MPERDDDTPELTRVDRLWYIVTGNGDPMEGLLWKVDKVRDTLKQQQEQWNEARAMFGKVLVGIVVAVLLAVGNLLITLSHK